MRQFRSLFNKSIQTIQVGRGGIYAPPRTTIKYAFFKYTKNQLETMITKTQNIPIISEKQMLQSNVQSDPANRQKEYLLNKLRAAQKQFFMDPQQCENAYVYIKVIFKKHLYIKHIVSKQALIIQGSNISEYKVFRYKIQQIQFQAPNLNKYNIQNSNTYEKMLKQIEFAQEKHGFGQAIMPDQSITQYTISYKNIFSGLFVLSLIYYLTSEYIKSGFYKTVDGESENNNKNEPTSTPPKNAEERKGKIDKFISIFQGKGSFSEEERNIPTRFSDVLGIDEFKEELEEIVDYLKNPKKYIDSGARLPRGLLLIGPPGTGKTLLARALAGEANCSFFYKSGAEFDEMFVGVGAQRVREMFKKAREKAPSIIFIDEIDSVGGARRAADPSHSRDTINQILTEMDGFKQSENVIVIGATNFEQSLDPAIKRPGRFDKIIAIPLPDMQGREQIFGYYLSKIKHEQEIQSGYLARQTSGFTGADIQNMVNVAILNAIKLKRQTAINDDFEFALDRISMGIGRKNLHVSEKDKLLTAYHEGGHALTSLLTDGAIPLHKVTILARGGALGFTSMIPENDMLNYTRKGIIAQIDVAMGGRAAEELFVGHNEVTSGCSSDLGKATQLAYMYVKQLGMDDKISLISTGDKIKTSEKYDFMIDMEVKKMLEESYNRVKSLLNANEDKLKSLATELIIKETLSAVQVKTLLNLS